MDSPRVSIQVVLWNSLDVIPACLSSLQEQTFRDTAWRFVDNASSDGGADLVKSLYPETTLLRNTKNRGFGAAHNQAMQYALEHWKGEDLTSKYIFVVNPDTVLTPTFLEQLVRAADALPSYGAFGGKLLRALRDGKGDQVLRETMTSQRIDSMGLKGNRAYEVLDRGEGELDEGQYDEEADVFGISGAMVLYRASAVVDVWEEGFFDPAFFMYKEDVDVAWRLQERGFHARIIPSAVAYHIRGFSAAPTKTLFARLRNRTRRSQKLNAYSVRNHWTVLVKHVSLREGFLRFPWLVPNEFGRFLYTLVFEHASFMKLLSLIPRLPALFVARRHLRRERRVSSKTLRAWFW